jgi:hypothetical protein
VQEKKAPQSSPGLSSCQIDDSRTDAVDDPHPPRRAVQAGQARTPPPKAEPLEGTILEGEILPPASQKQQASELSSSPGPASYVPPTDRRTLLTVEDVSRWFGVSVSILNQARLTGTGPSFIRLLKGGVVRYSVGSCLDYLAAREAKSTSEPIPE